MKYDPNSISHWTSDERSGANNSNVPSSDLPHISPESVGLIEEADHAEEDGPHVLGGVPSLTGQLTGLGVIHRGVEDGDAEVTVLVNVWVPHFWLESEGRRIVRVVGGELDVSLEFLNYQVTY